MTIQEIAAAVEGTVLTGADLDYEVEYGFASDLMSDVLTLSHEYVLFLTGLVAPQTIRTAIVSDIQVVLFVRGKAVPPPIVDLAAENDICLIATGYSMFRASGALAAAGISPIF
jgi:hypothetical protein